LSTKNGINHAAFSVLDVGDAFSQYGCATTHVCAHANGSSVIVITFTVRADERVGHFSSSRKPDIGFLELQDL
jgi:hypothetical protein